MARRLAALHHAPAAALLAHVARVAHAHADLDTRRYLLAAAAAHQPADGLEDVLTTRLALELEDLQPMAAALREQPHLSERWPSTDDEFDDAITTPVIEKKDLVAPPQPDKKAPLFTYLLDSIQSKFLLSDKSSSEDPDERTVHCPEFYRSLYPQHAAAGSCYGYARFTAPAPPPAARLLAGYYAHACLNHAAPAAPAVEPAVVQKCAEEILYKDTPLSVACMLRSTQDYARTKKLLDTHNTDTAVSATLYATLMKCNAPELRDNVYLTPPSVDTPLSVACMLRSTQDYARTKKLLDTHNTDTAVSATLYATLMKCNAPELRDNVYLTPPSVMAQTTLKQKNASQEQLEIIRECIDRLTGMGEVERLRRLGYGVNGLLFNADDDYRAETVYRVARSKEPEHVEAACSLGAKYGLSALDVWLQHAAAHVHAPLPPPAAATRQPGAHDRIKETLWPLIRGDDHSALINLFTILKGIDDKPPLFGLTAAEHIKLLKKVKAASSELDYKMLLEQPTTDQYSAHLLRVLKPENVGMVVKLIRTLPPAFKPPLSVNALYTMWLTRLFFSVPPSAASNKKWMQQYRQCASYFNKLAKDDLQEFVANTCFTREAIERVPAGTRSLMIMQAVDYCQQEQENDFKFNKNEQTWAGVGQELSRWARFLDNFHSSTIQALVEGSGVPRTEIWPEIEMSHGDPDKVIEQAAALVSRGMRAGPLSSLLQCLVGEDSHRAFEHLARHANTLQDVETLVDRIMQYHKEGVKFPEELLESVMHAGSSLGLPPHKQIALLSLGRARVLSGDDLPRVARYTADLLRGEWPDLDYVRELTEEKLLTPEGRCEAFSTLICAADTWQRRKALVDALNCWPHTLNSDSRSLHCVYLESLLSYTSELKESLVLIKLLLRRPVLNEEEIKWVLEPVHPAACVNALWTAALARAPPAAVLGLLRAHMESFRKQEIDDELIKELLDSGIFLKLVSTPIYSSVINYIISRESSSDEASNAYSVSWAVEELRKANYLAEAGHLQFLAIGVPSPLRGFSQSIQYCKKMFSKKI